MLNMSIIGGSDGPTSIFIAGQLGPEWINWFGLSIVVLMLLPNIIYAVRFRGIKNQCENKVLNIIEQIGRYASMFLMVFHIGIAEYGVSSIEIFLLYGIGNIVLLISYWLVWMFYFKSQTFRKSMALAIIPTCIFFLSGISLQHYLLIFSSILFGIGHIFVTYQNSKYK